MMTQAFYTGVSGLKSNAAGIDVVANNLANISTVGFREYKAEFASLFGDIVEDTSKIISDTVGDGVRLQTTSMNNTQGTLQIADRSTDLAILGDGWFGVQNGDEVIYTRDGAFSIDANANLVTEDGFYVLGTLGNNFSANNVLTQVLSEVDLGPVATQEKLTFPTQLTYPPKPSTQASFLGNIGVGSEPVSMGASVIDQFNNKNDLQLIFTKNASQTPPTTQYSVQATITSADGTTVFDSQQGSVSFDGRGALVQANIPTLDNNGTPLTIDIGKDFEGIIALDTPKHSTSSSVDGTRGGELEKYTITQSGDVMATFSNGEQSSIAKVAVFHFQNDQGLTRVSGARFQESANSGKAMFYQDASGKNVIGTHLVNYRLESSNVDYASGLTEMIMLQRSYGANSKSVTTADEMMKKALSMDA